MLLNKEIDEDYIFPVYICEDILKSIKTQCKRIRTENFGYLVGNVFKWKDIRYIVIEKQLFVMTATHSQQYTASQTDGSAGKIEEQIQTLKNKNSNGLRILGWWHSHPVIQVRKDDIETHNFYFSKPYNVLMIVNEEGEKFSFFNTEYGSDDFNEIDYAIIPSNNIQM